MPKANKKGVQAGNDAADTASSTGKALNSRAMSLQDTLEPQLEGDIANPQGFGTTGLNSMNTAIQQSTGGSTGGIVGQGNLTAARTRNAGAFTAAAQEASREGTRTAADNTLKVQGMNENLKAEQRASALRAKQGLFGSDLSGSLQAMGLVPGDINAATKAEGPSWLDQLSQMSGIAANAGKAYSGFHG
jgi:hypothetical protein